MKGDFTRWTFRPQEHYRGVLKQQGRVDLDSDWNEQVALTSHRVEAEALDVIGPCGAPQGDAGFLLHPDPNSGALTISAGRAYVDGILCENDQPNLPITAQPDLPGFQLPSTTGAYFAYLEVWERHLTFLDDAEIMEVALGGPDTCTRAKTVWQVKLLAAGTGAVDCSTDLPDYDKLIAPSSGTLQAQAQPTATTDPCMVPAAAGYRSLENQLYRVEIHNGGTGDAKAGSGTASFKWSRDNGSVVASWITPPSGQTAGPNTVFLGSAPKDSALGFAAGQWIELSDDSRELNFQPGTLVQLTNVQGQVLTVDPSTVIPSGGSLNLADYKLNPKVRRWDSAGAGLVTTGGWFDLENGVQVQFSGGTYTTGDYWLIPARTLTANIDWPVDGSGHALAQPPKGIQRHYCRLAILQFDGKAWSLTTPCLPIFPPLTGITAGSDNGIHVTDVRSAVPDAPLLNDSNVELQPAVVDKGEFTIKVLCDAPIDPVSAKPTTCLVTMETPYPLDLGNPTNTTILGYQSLSLPVTVAVSNATGASQILITLTRLTLDFIAFGLLSLKNLKLPAALMMHVNLKGNCIWGLNDPTLYLDGEAFGVTRKDADSSTHIGLRLPESGDGKRGGYFDMWFWFVLPLTIDSLAFAPPTVNSGQASAGTITLSGPAPAGGAIVALSSNNATLIGTLASVTVPANQATATFAITKTTLPPGGGSVAVQVTATYLTSSAQATLTINAVVTVVKVAFNPATLVAGAASQLTVTLNVPAPAGGVTVAISANIGAADAPPATIPASVTVAAGQTAATVNVTTLQKPVNSASSVVKVTATLNGTATATLTINSQRLT